MTAINPQAVRGPVTAVPVVAGNGVRFVEDVENNRVVAEVDETVLYSSDTGGSNITLSESPMNFERLKIFFGTQRSGNAGKNIGMNYSEVLTSTLVGGRQGSPSVGYLTLMGFLLGDNSTFDTPYLTVGEYTGANTTTWTRSSSGKIYNLTSNVLSTDAQWVMIYKIIGINRIASA